MRAAIQLSLRVNLHSYKINSIAIILTRNKSGDEENESQFVFEFLFLVPMFRVIQRNRMFQRVSWVDNWFRKDQMKIIVQFKMMQSKSIFLLWRLPFVCVEPVKSVGMVCFWLHYILLIFIFTSVCDRKGFFFVSSALFFLPSECDNRDKLAKERKTLQVCGFFSLHISVYSLLLNNARREWNLLECYDSVFLKFFSSLFTFVSLRMKRVFSTRFFLFLLTHHKHHLSNRNLFCDN